MSMIKVIPIGSWDFGMEPIAVIKVSSNGLTFADRQDFFQKRAAAGIFANLLNKFAVAPGEIPIHTVAIGATEQWGANRNGDGFDEHTCMKHASSFVSRPLRDYQKNAHNGARYFLDHANTEPRKSYGYVKAAAYNPDMRRIELLIVANGDKRAADRNGGLVLPDHIRHDLHNDKAVAGSMSCKISHDVCSVCSNEAPSRKEYCTKESCISADGVRGFGCKEGLTKLLKTGRMQYVENPNPIFFDFSHVGRPADRTAYGGIAREYMKSASTGDIVKGGAWLAEQFGMISDGLVLGTKSASHLQRELQLVHKLAEIEKDLDENTSTRDLATKAAFDKRVQPDEDLSPMGPVLTDKFASSLRALAEAEIMLTPRDFLKLAGVAGEDLDAAEQELRGGLPTVFRKLAADEDLAAQLDHPFAVDQTVFTGQEQRNFAAKLAQTRTICLCQLPKRAQLAVIRGCEVPSSRPARPNVKSASAAAHGLARHYALYQLSTIAANTKVADSMLTLRAILVQNSL
jgi:hypothetical protein